MPARNWGFFSEVFSDVSVAEFHESLIRLALNIVVIVEAVFLPPGFWIQYGSRLFV